VSAFFLDCLLNLYIERILILTTFQLKEGRDRGGRRTHRNPATTRGRAGPPRPVANETQSRRGERAHEERARLGDWYLVRRALVQDKPELRRVDHADIRRAVCAREKARYRQTPVL
jgi:hypothetical protein